MKYEVATYFNSFNINLLYLIIWSGPWLGSQNNNLAPKLWKVAHAWPRKRAILNISQAYASKACLENSFTFICFPLLPLLLPFPDVGALNMEVIYFWDVGTHLGNRIKSHFRRLQSLTFTAVTTSSLINLSLQLSGPSFWRPLPT
jgi:hypothetical protein